MRQILNSATGWASGCTTGCTAGREPARPEAPPTQAGVAQPLAGLSPPSLGPRRPGRSESSIEEGAVLIHGLGRSPASMWLLARRLERAGFAVARVGYPSRRIALAEALSSVTEQVRGFTRGWRRVHLVGHSLGGVIARRLALSGVDDRIGRVVQLGSPNAGAPVASLLVRWRATRWVFGPVLEDIVQERAPAVSERVGAVAGRLPRLGGDGLVPVASALAGAGSGAEITALHTALPVSTEAARLTVRFLRHGHFA